MRSCSLVLAVLVSLTSVAVAQAPAKPAPPPAPTTTTTTTTPAPAPAAPAGPCATGDACLQEALAAMQKKDFAASIAPLRRACDLGAAWGCAGLAQRLERGEGIGKDINAAVATYVKACDLGANNACYNLAGLRWTGAAGTVDAADAIRLMKRACDLGQPKGCEQATAYQAALAAQAPAPPDERCAKGDLDGCVDYADDLIEHDNKKALAVATKACKKNHLRSCAIEGIAMSYVGARGWQGKAMKLWKRACDGGDTVGCRELAIAYQEGLVGKPDDAKAQALFERGCAGNDPDATACNKVCDAAYYDGRYDRELAFGRISCGLEDADGCDHVGVASQHLSDFTGAARAYAQACDLGNGHGCSMLQGWYSGQFPVPGIAADPAKAAEYDAKMKAIVAKQPQ